MPTNERYTLDPPIILCPEDHLDPMTTIILTEYQRPAGAKALNSLAHSGQPYCRISVNIPECAEHLGENEFFCKNYSEAEAVYAALVARGILVPTGQYAASERVKIPICTFHPEKCRVS